ncbi:trans-2-enoyl-CoA reductase [Histoplasma ohiense]|nr:trans-2-enoyl-CoA reductase [Histoplasma ohiense (nom. inval.)]
MPLALTFAKPSWQAVEALLLENYPEPEPKDNEVLIEFLAAPVNHLDLLVIAGGYPIKPKFQLNGNHLGGFDGVGRVLKCGKDVTKLTPSDLVIPKALGLGTWRTHATLIADDLIAIPPTSDVTFAAILKTCVLPAYLLLEDMKQLKPGDWIIQNAGLGAISQMISQLAHLRGVKVISVIRDRSPGTTWNTTADIVLNESELPNAEILKGKRIMLGLDSVFGQSGEKIASCLSAHATFVNYGQLSGGGPAASVNLTHQQVYWNRLTFRCFRGTEQVALRTDSEIKDLYAWFTELFADGRLKSPKLNIVNWSGERDVLATNIRAAIERQQSPVLGTEKTVFLYESATKSSQCRIPYVDLETAPEGVVATLKKMPMKRNIFYLLSHSPGLFPPIMGVYSAFFQKATRTLPLLDWQLIVLRIASTLECEYEWNVNAPVAKVHGMSEEVIGAIKACRKINLDGDNTNDTSPFSKRQLVILKFVDEQLKTYTNEEDTMAQLLGVLTYTELVEAVYVIGFYVMIARLIKAVGIDLDPEILGLEDMIKAGVN